MDMDRMQSPFLPPDVAAVRGRAATLHAPPSSAWRISRRLMRGNGLPGLLVTPNIRAPAACDAQSTQAAGRPGMETDDHRRACPLRPAIPARVAAPPQIQPAGRRCA